jgi:hypothetical protein
VEKHILERRLSQAIHNSKVKLSPLAVLRGLSRGAEIQPIAEDMESKTVEKEEFVPTLGQKSENTFAVGGKVVRLSKSATTGRIVSPHQDFQIPSKRFERPKISPSDDAHASTLTAAPKQAEASPFTVLADLSSPRPFEAPVESQDKVNPYEAIVEGDDGQSEIENVHDLSPKLANSTRGSFLPQTRGRSKSDEASANHTENVSRNSFFVERAPVSDKVVSDVAKKSLNPPECTPVSGFDDNQPGSGSGSPMQHPPIHGHKWSVADLEE